VVLRSRLTLTSLAESYEATKNIRESNDENQLNENASYVDGVIGALQN